MSRFKKSKMSLKFCSAESNPFLDGHIDQLFRPISNLDEMGLVCCPSMFFHVAEHSSCCFWKIC